MQWSLEELEKSITLLEGGRGGLGNEYFKSSRNTSPYESTPGQPGADDVFDIELQLFADIGLVGLPSAGKSTLLNATTNAKSKVAAYHFTTLDPHLGVLPSGKIMADLPGIIEGASEGKGLGFKFLRHIKRTKVVAHLVSCENEDVVAAYTGIRHELETYGQGLANKKEIIILSKIDECTDKEWKTKQKELEKATGKPVLGLSAFNDVLVADIQKQLSDFCE
jgi:GTP-binding protein